MNEFTSAGEPPTAPTPGMASPVGAWERVRRGWAGTTTVDYPAVPGLADTSIRITIEEGLAAARHWGATAVPGTNPGYLSPLTPEATNLALAIAWRSLLARGVVADGRFGETVRTACRHDLLVSTLTGTGARWIAARPDWAVFISVAVPEEELVLTPFPTAELVDRVLGMADDSTLVQTVFRSGNAICGGDLAWTNDEAERREQLLAILPGGD